MFKAIGTWVVVVVLAADLHAADPKPQELASTAAAEFMKAYSKGDVDAIMKLVDTPFLAGGLDKDAVKQPLTDEKDVRKLLEDLTKKFRDKPPANPATDVLKVMTIGEALKENPIEDKDKRNAVVTIAGESGFLVFVGRKADKNEGLMLFIKMKDGKAKVVSPPLG